MLARVLALAMLALATVLPNAAADPPPAVPDAVAAGAVLGTVFHDEAGMCYLEHGTCPFPWEVAGNLAGDCRLDTAPSGVYRVECFGVWRDLFFNFIVGGGGARVTPPLGPATWWAQYDLLWMTGMEGVVVMVCDPNDPGINCVTNFSGNVPLARKWDCYVHHGATSEDCANDGP